MRGGKPPVRGPHRRVGEADLGENRRGRDQVEDLLERDVQGNVHDAEATARTRRFRSGCIRTRFVSFEVEHHRVLRHVAVLGQDLGMPRVNDAGLMKGQLVERQRRDRVDLAGQGEPGGCREELVGRAAGSGIDPTGGDIGEVVWKISDPQARDDGRRGVGLFGQVQRLDA